MPVMDGIEAVRQIMQAQPTPILRVSSLTTEDATITMDALDLGAVDYIAKPGTMNVGKNENREEILTKVGSLSRISPRRLKRKMARPPVRERRRTQAAIQEREIQDSRTSKDIEKVVLIGSSTGGPGLIEQFTSAFAQCLDRASVLPVVETKQNMELLPGHIYVARGGVHRHFAKKVSGKIVIREEKEKGICFFQPSVNEMMNSAAEVFESKNIVAVILTGIGDDGADAIVRLKKGGAYTLGESEESATVYGMPKEAYDRGGVSEQLNFNGILKKVSTLR